jgi:hypothetical protein
MTVVPVFNVTIKERYVYRIIIEETGEYCINNNNEPCECATRGWADILFDDCQRKYPGKSLVLVREKYIVKNK